MSSVIQNLLETTLNDGARSAKFDCYINILGDLIGPEASQVLVKTSQFPGKTHEVIDFKFKGRNIPIKGQVKYDNTWTCTFYMTEQHNPKIGFLNWIESLDQQHNMQEPGRAISYAQDQFKELGYVINMSIAQLDFESKKEAVIYDLYNVFPKSVSANDANYSDVGVIHEVTVEFSYTHFSTRIVEEDGKTLVDELKDKADKYIRDQVNSAKSFLTDQTANAKEKLVGTYNDIIGNSSKAGSSESTKPPAAKFSGTMISKLQ